MRDKMDKRFLCAKSYTSLYDMFCSDPLHNALYKRPKKKNIPDMTVYHAVCGDADPKSEGQNVQPHYITSEIYNRLHKNASLDDLRRSTSTIFYDLDYLARKQSLNYFLDMKCSATKQNIKSNKSKKKDINGFQGKSDIIVQECATQMYPKIVRDSASALAAQHKKLKRLYPNDLVLSSEIFLRDNNYEDAQNMKRYFDREVTNQQQKFWSYAKYRAEYRDPIPEEKKSKKKERDRDRDRGKRIEDPCPCQLFSYACPCTEQKSLTELAKNSKSLAVTEQTSTSKLEDYRGKSRRDKHDVLTKDNKLVCTSFETISPLPKVEHVVQAVVHDLKQASESKFTNKFKGKSGRKGRLLICPHCKEKLEIQSSVEDSLHYHQQISATATAHATFNNNKTSNRTTASMNSQEEECCVHDPPCDLIPLCQVIPDNYHNVKMKKMPPKPRVIRITKACRHHPPCTVVPSCQRANVLKNNCEFIPPCLHRPRCVNLPLCVPISKTFNLEEFAGHQVESVDSCEYTQQHQCKHGTLYPDSMEKDINPQFNFIPQIQNACEFVNRYQYQSNTHPRHTSVCPAAIFTPYRVVSRTECSLCKLTKSCQYDLTDSKIGSLKESVSDAVIFIRDVGCQFRNRTYSPTDSIIPSKTSSASFEYINDRKMGNYFTTVHTLRYQDKFTAPSKVTLYSLTTSLSTTDVDSQCPSHGNRAMSVKSVRPTGFAPTNTTQYVAFSTHSDCMTFNRNKRGNFHPGFPTCPLQSMRNMSKAKKKFSTRRRKKSRGSSVALNPKRIMHQCIA